MSEAGISISGRSRKGNWTFAGIFGLLVITAVSIIPLTLTSIHYQESDALVIDVAGRQRMLIERYTKELLLESQGPVGRHERTLELLKHRVTSLLDGGPVGLGDDRMTGPVLPPAPTEAIRAGLREQRRLLDGLSVMAGAMLNASSRGPDFIRQRDEMLHESDALLIVANDVVSLLTRHSAARINALIRWELLAVLVVIGVGSLRTWQFQQAEAEVERSQATVMEAFRQRDAVKSSLLSSVSHELRTPLTSIKTMLFNLRDDAAMLQAPLRQELIHRIDEELDYLDRLVGNLLDMSRIEAGAMCRNREWHLLEELAEGAVRLVSARFNGRLLEINLDPDIPPLWVDGVEIQQVLVNLLDNAIKFSPPGASIALRSKRTSNYIEVSVANDGPGIPETELQKIFDRFYRVPARGSSRIPGTGLGLAICKAIVESHGGEIAARSTPGSHTIIEFTLPLATRDAVRTLHHLSHA
ncbi:putative Histidine kinase [Nitrospira sp. KM1]|uniref:sensor histidine kinase n=1 Tax=Nitrospira sp. KM1 TaxID=1936990 RepID=UPI0013A78DEF|nr:ATP-binding protein [Nitrospira sp. KM1]BCA53595.1 putative Histidine kinase [Nitrospira sp. KM1]